MTIAKFKIGNIVKRVRAPYGIHMGMDIGDIDEIINIEGGDLTLKNFSSGHLHTSFELQKNNWRNILQ